MLVRCILSTHTIYLGNVASFFPPSSCRPHSDLLITFYVINCFEKGKSVTFCWAQKSLFGEILTRRESQPIYHSFLRIWTTTSIKMKFKFLIIEKKTVAQLLVINLLQHSVAMKLTNEKFAEIFHITNFLLRRLRESAVSPVIELLKNHGRYWYVIKISVK